MTGSARVGVGSRSVARRPSMTGADLMWRDVETAWCMSPVELPSLDRLRSTLLTLGKARPGHRLMCRLDADGRRWTPVPAAERKDHIAELITRTDAGPHDAAPLVQQWLAGFAHERRLPFTMVLGDQVLLTALPHVFGDWTYAEHVQVEVLRAAREGRVAEALLRRSVPVPLARALVTQARRSPREFFDVLRAPLARPQAGRPAQVTAPQPAMASGGPAGQTFARASAWRSAHARRLSMVALVTAATARVLGAHGLPVSPRLHMLADGRRYLGAGAYVAGNFVTGIHVDTDDPGDPADVQRAMKHGLGDGRPLAALARGAVAARLPGRSRTPGPPCVGEQVALSMSFVQRAGGIPWLGAVAPRQMVGAAWGPWSPSVNVQVVSDGELMTFTAGYDAGLLDGSAVSAALRELAADPLGSLSWR